MTPKRSEVLPKGPVLLDGGVGTEISRRGYEERHPSIGPANALLTDPTLVQSVHEDYLRAGADIITTSTYSTPRDRLEEVGLTGQVEAINRRAGQLAEQARQETGNDALIAGSLPPIRGSYRPDWVGDRDELEPQYREQAQLLAPYVDLFLCETMSRVREAQAALAGAEATELPVLVSYTIPDTPAGNAEEPSLRSGEPLSEAVQALADHRAEGVLLNCSIPERITAAMPFLRDATERPIGGYANAFTGIPEGWNEKTDATPDRREDLGPEAYGAHAQEWIASGAQIVGGCCEVGPAHIAHLREIIDRAADARGAGSEA
ncbi:MAG: homocysteine S-methyltransferase family protein [Salinibacter sp.]